MKKEKGKRIKPQVPNSKEKQKKEKLHKPMFRN